MKHTGPSFKSKSSCACSWVEALPKNYSEMLRDPRIFGRASAKSSRLYILAFTQELKNIKFNRNVFPWPLYPIRTMSFFWIRVSDLHNPMMMSRPRPSTTDSCIVSCSPYISRKSSMSALSFCKDFEHEFSTKLEENLLILPSL